MTEDAGIPRFKTLKQKLAYYTAKEKGKACHLWTGYVSEQGYGIVRWKDKTLRAHRAAYEVANGPIPEASVIHHTCSTRNCINAKHLQAVTHAENTAEMLERRMYVNKIAELEKRLEKYEQS